MEEADKLVGTGKRHLVMGKAVEAVNVLQEACGMLAKKYGDTADECGEAFFWCGKALLDLARMENTVLGNALEGVPEEDAEEEEKSKDSNVDSTENVDEKTRDELRAQVYDAMAAEEEEKKNVEADEDGEEKGDAEAMEGVDDKEQTDGHANGTDSAEGKEKENEKIPEVENGEKKSTENIPEVENGEKKSTEKIPEEENGEKKSTEKIPEVENGEKKSTEKIPEVENGEKKSTEKPEEEEEEEEAEDDEGDDEAEEEAEKEGEGDATADKDSDDDEVGNLQLAWEMLEVAKVIYKRKENKEDQLMAAQAHLKLGEVASESGNYPQALEDFQECLKLQLKHLASDSRLLAETHYQLGLAFGFNNQLSQSIEQFNCSISVIKSRLAKLQEVIDKAEGPEAAQEDGKEMEELNALLPEIQERIEDATESLKTASADTDAMKDALLSRASGSASTFPAPSSQNGEASTSSMIPVKSTNGVSSSTGDAAAAPVSDISHLVRKKRKPEDSPVKEGEPKKTKQDHTNGLSDGSGDTGTVHTNGVNEKMESH